MGAEEEKKRKNSMRFRWPDWLKVIGLAFIFAFFITRFVVSATLVEGSSMCETLHDQDRIFVWRFGVSIDSIRRGDIVVFHAPDAPGKDYIKRVIALPNEYVQIADGTVYVNGVKINEPYINTAYTYATMQTEWLVGDNEFFVLGDNRERGASKDSRILGPISADALLGHAVFRFFPFHSFGGI